MKRQVQWLLLATASVLLVLVGFSQGMPAKAYTISGPFYNASSATNQPAKYGDISFTSYFETADGKSSYANAPYPRTLIDPKKQPVGSTINLIVTMTNTGGKAEKVNRNILFQDPATVAAYYGMQLGLAKNAGSTFKDVAQDTADSGFTVTYDTAKNYNYNQTYDAVKANPDSVDKLGFTGTLQAGQTVTYTIPLQIKRYLTKPSDQTNARYAATYVDPTTLDDSIGGYRFDYYFGELGDYLFLPNSQTPNNPKVLTLNFAGKADRSVPTYPTSIGHYAVAADADGHYNFDPTDFGVPADQKAQTTLAEIVNGKDGWTLKTDQSLPVYGGTVTNTDTDPKDSNQVTTGPFNFDKDVKVAQYLAKLSQPSQDGQIANKVVLFDVLPNDAPKISAKDATIDSNTAITPATFTADPADASVYVLDANNNLVTLSDKKTVPAGTYTVLLTKVGDVSKKVTLTVKAAPEPTPTPTPNTSSNNDTATGTIVTPSTNSSSTTNSNASSTSTTTTTEPAKTTSKTITPKGAYTKGTAVYATKKIYLYKNATFKKSQRVVKYNKAKRVNRPMFVVTGYAYSKGGALRYKVRDVNHGKKSANKTGYITANKKYVVNVYYNTLPKNKRITVINKRGVNVYKKANLTKKVKNYKQGTHLKVKKIVRHNLTSRYQLTNGDYITGNKKLVIQGNH
ncbi:hypothetical protein YK48G_22110 [Lentilactobacillus fungorum]|uniref:DUF5776 domain-containing protein n=1 Tax=Lentilactobacillus fungorum TaxID=2201250 RepID=A0ABQ3W3I6_9LACO|nr:DUF5776 domain-containing protein [Lentilactobacillus fungorum]GHP14786.1 hypothetical protein YK48G_22110 [Lentilactobacillus fungorum]